MNRTVAALALELFGPATEVVRVMRPSPGYSWFACPTCGEWQLRARGSATTCSMTPACCGKPVAIYVARCEGCGEVLTGRSKDGRFCRAACRKGEG